MYNQKESHKNLHLTLNKSSKAIHLDIKATKRVKIKTNITGNMDVDISKHKE